MGAHTVVVVVVEVVVEMVCDCVMMEVINGVGQSDDGRGQCICVQMCKPSSVF